MCHAVASGDCPDDLAAKLPGPVNHARWLTTACRILRLYVTEVDPTDALKALATFVMRVYAPMWFHIKTHNTIMDAPKNLSLTIVRTRYLCEDQQEIHTVLQNNAFWAHPENLLVAMLKDERNYVREKAAAHIIEARSVRLRQKKEVISKFDLPKLNFTADDYVDLIDWSACDVTEPPITMSLTTENFEEILAGDETSLQPIDSFFSLPCHSQAVERIVKEVTAASDTVFGHATRDGFIRARLLNRQIMPKFDSKSQFQC